MAKMVLMARTSARAYMNNFQGEDWQEVKEGKRSYPSGERKVYVFADGFACKVERCEAVYVFEK